MTQIRTMIVDDEPLARAKIRSLLSDDPDVAIVAEASNGEDAVAAIEAQHPDLVFLDVQMPEMDGFGVIEAVGADRMPMVIFATAYDEYAVQAFEVYALDYLLKPIDRDRFADALRRAKTRLGDSRAAEGKPEDGAPKRSETANQLQPFVEHLSRQHQRSARLAIKTEGKMLFLRTAEIDWIEAVDNYAKLHVGKQTYVVRDTLARLEQRLPADRFLRIHRSTIVNVDRVRELQPWFQGDWVVILVDGSRLTTGRSYRARLQKFVEEMS